MDETLKIKLTVDTSELKASVAQAKQTLASVGNDSGANKATKETEKSMKSLEDTMTQIRNMNMFDLMIKGLDRARQSFRKAKAEVHGLGGALDMFKNMGLSFGSSKNFTDNTDYFTASFGNRMKWATDMAGEGFKGMGRSLGYLGQSAKAFVSSFTAGLGAIIASLAIVAGYIASIVALTKNAINRAKELKKEFTEASKINMNIQTYQEWGYVLKQCGIEADKLTDFVKKLAEKQKEVASGSEEATSAYKELGMSQKEIMSMGQAELFDKTIEKLQQVENATQRTALAYRIFTDDAVYLNSILHLTNGETQSLINNYYALGGAPTDTLIERSNLLSASTTNLSYAWAGVKNTLAEAVLPAVIAVVQWLTKAIAVINVFLQALLGVEIGGGKSKSSMNNATAGVKNYGSALGSAAKSAKELLRYTMGFDELNVIPGQSGSGSSSGNGLGSGAFGAGGFNTDLPIVEVPDMSKLKAWVEEYKTVIQDVATISLLVIGILMTVLGFAGGNIPLALAGIGLAGLGIAIGSIEGSTFDRLGKKLADWWNGIEKWFKEHVAPVFTKQYWIDKWDKIKTSTSEKIEEIKKKVSDWWDGVKTWFGQHVGKYFTKKYWNEKFDNIKQSASEKLEETKSKISEKWSGVKTWFGNHVGKYFTLTYWKEKFNNIKQGASEKLDEVKTTLSNKWNGIKTWWSNSIAPKFTIAYWKEKFNTIKDGAKTAFNGVIDTVERAINAIIKKINTLSWKIPDWVPKVGGETFGFNFKEVSIPRLAKGGIALGSSLVNVGEAGKEAILPLENNTGWMDVLANKIASRNSAPSKIVLMVGEKELGYATIDAFNGIYAQTGNLPIKLV